MADDVQTMEEAADDDVTDPDREPSPTPSISDSVSSYGSLDDSARFAPNYQPSIDELPAFAISSMSPSGLSISPIDTEPLCLLNISISPISCDFADDDDDDENGEDERVSLEEINAQINTPPPTDHHNGSKRLHLETIFEGVFLETPPKKKRFDSWRIPNINTITVERINSYVMEQQQKNELTNDPNRLCDMFQDNVDIS